MKVIVANDVMMKAYRQGLPADGKLFPEGSKIVKIEWSFKRNTVAPYFVNVPDALQAVERHRKRQQAIPGHPRLGLRRFQLSMPRPTLYAAGTDSNCGYACHTAVAKQDYIFTAYPKH